MLEIPGFSNPSTIFEQKYGGTWKTTAAAELITPFPYLEPLYGEPFFTLDIVSPGKTLRDRPESLQRGLSNQTIPNDPTKTARRT